MNQAPLEIIQLIINKYHPDFTLQDDRGTVLHKATIMGSYDVVKLLLDLGADPTIKNEENKIAKDYTSNPDLRSILESYEHNPDLKEPI